MEENEVVKQNGSPSISPATLDFDNSFTEQNHAQIKVIVHQDGLEKNENLRQKHTHMGDSGDHIIFVPEPKLKTKISASLEPTELDDAITPLSDESSPGVPDKGWAENPAMGSNELSDSGCCGRFYSHSSSDDQNTVSCGHIVGIIVCFCFYVANLATDIAVCYFLYLHGSMLWFALVAAFTIIPTIVLNIISYHLSVYKMIVKQSLWNQAESIVVSVVIALLHLSQCGILVRYLGYIFQHELEYLWVVFCTKKYRKNLNHHTGRNVEISYIPYLFLVEAIVQCLPQLILQLFMLIKGQEYLQQDTEMALIVSVVVTLLNLTRLLTVCKHVLKNFTTSWSGLALMFSWNLFINISRILAFSLFATNFLLGFVILCVCHWLIMSVWAVQLQTTVECQDFSRCQQNIKKYLKSLLYGVMYLICFMRVDLAEDSSDHGLPTRYFYAFFYSVIFLENTVLTVLWYIYSDPTTWYHLPALIVVLGSFLVGMAFMLIYYRYFHQNVINNPIRWKRVMLFPTNRFN